MLLATAVQSPTQVAGKNQLASDGDANVHSCVEQRNELLATVIICPTTRPHKAKMVTPTYTVVLLQIAILLEPRAKPASPLCAVGLRDGGLHGCQLE